MGYKSVPRSHDEKSPGIGGGYKAREMGGPGRKDSSVPLICFGKQITLDQVLGDRRLKPDGLGLSLRVSGGYSGDSWGAVI